MTSEQGRHLKEVQEQICDLQKKFSELEQHIEGWNAEVRGEDEEEVHEYYDPNPVECKCGGDLIVNKQGWEECSNCGVIGLDDEPTKKELQAWLDAVERYHVDCKHCPMWEGHSGKKCFGGAGDSCGSNWQEELLLYVREKVKDNPSELLSEVKLQMLKDMLGDNLLDEIVGKKKPSDDE